MLQGGYASVLQARSREDFRGEVVRFAQTLGFNTVSALAVIDHGIGRSEFVYVDNTPAAFTQVSTDTAKMRRDPVMQHCRRQSIPIIWDQNTYTSQGVGELWEEQAQFGYCTGVALALHLPEGRHFAFGVERDKPLPSDRVELTRLVADLQLFAVMAQDAALRVLAPSLPELDRPALTPRELEVLRWTMDGKTAWEVGMILGISERTAVLHVNNAMHKLGCANKHQAVLKALRLGLIQ
ncbi:helix-turn-helix transcriptional regulator [Aquabacterium sp.]|uniref:helix-turn-helix transcriptional regulator n=1 Tax=Aquabacterium sp. TaxID=1872578 RepID=UPI002CCE905B|nr:LuxR family transcriptional regulator [Aquabacterium sp.]HSW08847.1 LuxR family transcriptional regulator [Aquabacterium sp.]